MSTEYLGLYCSIIDMSMRKLFYEEIIVKSDNF